MRLGYLISWLHPILVHFPIALLLSAFVAEGIGWRENCSSFSRAAKGLLAAGCVISLFAFVSGNFAEVFAVRGGTPHDPVDAHGIWAMITTWAFILLTVARFYLEPPATGGCSIRFGAYFLGLAVASGLLIYTGHQGGGLVFDHGANVMAGQGGHALDMRDLRDLYQEQTRESVIYSEMMHHIFGWLVLALSLFLIASRAWPEQTRQLWRGGPYVLLAGGCFLMIFSDTDSWPLSDARPVYDKEVLQHKIFAILMLTAGIGGLTRRRQKSAALHSSNYHLALALLALVGGGLLFTHVHSVAPYSNRAVGVYLHHLVMGIIALCAGAVSLWEAWSPIKGGRRAYLWPGILLVESVLLVFYNEDIPWFVQPFANRPVKMKHDPHYRLEIQPEPARPAAGQVCRLRFELKESSSDRVLGDLEVVHEHPLHLMIVSKDLSFFDHVHPAPQKDGSLVLDYRFPHGGEFVLFSDLVPKGKTTQSFRHPIHVEGTPPSPRELAENAYDTVKLENKRQVLLFTKPVILAPGQPARLRFVLFDEKEKGLSDLEPFLGCFGHCIIISKDTDYYLHTHPNDHQHSASKQSQSAVSLEPVPNAEEGLPKLGPQRQMMFAMGMSIPSMQYSGPEVVFPACFPRSGLYKVWGQFQHRGEILTTPFVVRVP